MLTRRQLLRHLGNSAAAVTVARVLGACHRSRLEPVAVPREVSASFRTQLAELVDQLGRRYPIASALAIARSRVVAGRDPSDAGVNRGLETTLIVQVFDGASWRVRVGDDFSPAGVADLSATFLANRAPVAERAVALAEPIDISARSSAKPETDEESLAMVDDLYARASSRGTSRTIYRAASLEWSAEDSLFIGSGKNVRQRINRKIAAVTFVVRSGEGLVAEDAASASSGAGEAALSDMDLESASSAALSIVGGEPISSKDVDVILDAGVTAEIVRVLAVNFLDARQWSAGSLYSRLIGDQVADRRFSLVDDALMANAYGSYDYDDEGAEARLTTLIGEGVLVAPFNDRASAANLAQPRSGNGRLHADGVTRASFSNLRVAAGEESRQELIGAVKRGYVVDGVTVISANPRRSDLLLRARRAHEVIGGALTGRVVGPLALRADPLGLLLAVRGVSRETRSFSLAGAIAQSITAPSLLTRAEVSG